MSSSRLPGKSLVVLGDVPVIDWVVRRSMLADTVDTVVVATSTDATDDPLVEHLTARGWPVVRGALDDVLDRYSTAIESVPHERIVRVTGDCPFVQPELIDASVGLLDGGVEYVATGHDDRFPRGFDVEAVARTAVLAAAGEADDPIEREHVTPFIARRPDRFPARRLPSPDWAQRPDLRLTLDEADDLTMLRAVVDGLGASPESLDGRAVIDFLDDHPDIAAINRHVAHNTEH